MDTRMDKSLKDFTASLVPSDKYIEVVTQLSEKVLRALKAKSKARIDRVIYAGSLGKSTEILTPDVDLTIFVNEEMPPYKRILDDWEDILQLDESLKVDENSIRKTDISLQFKFLGDGFEVDLLPATNFVDKTLELGGKALADAQKEATMKVIMENPRDYRDFSSSLSECQIYFMKEQSQFAHQVVRLGKFWYKSLYLGPKPIYGLKSVLELIAVSAAMKEDERDKKSLLRAFCKFLDDVGKLSQLQLGFIKNGQGSWVLSHGPPPNGLRRDYDVGANFVFEPSNPFNNLANNFRNRDLELKNLMDFAKITRARFRTAMDTAQVGAESVFNLFRPLPASLLPTVFARIPKPEILSGVDPDFQRYHPDTKVNNESMMKKPGMWHVRKSLEIFLIAATHTATAALLANNQPVTLNDVKKFVQMMMSEDVLGGTYTPWTPGNGNHEDYDVTFTVPLFTRIELGALKTSFRFKM